MEALPWEAAPGSSEALWIPAYAGMTSPAAAYIFFTLASIRKLSRFVFVEVCYVCEKMGAFIPVFAGRAG